MRFILLVHLSILINFPCTTSKECEFFCWWWSTLKRSIRPSLLIVYSSCLYSHRLSFHLFHQLCNRLALQKHNPSGYLLVNLQCVLQSLLLCYAEFEFFHLSCVKSGNSSAYRYLVILCLEFYARQAYLSNKQQTQGHPYASCQNYYSL